jgi:hypothetical protein
MMKTDCEGCNSRDRMIAILAKRVDELEIERDEAIKKSAEVDRDEQMRKFQRSGVPA